MKKINNKGMTVVEVIVTFSMLMILVIGMFKMVIEMKESSKKKQLQKDLYEYSDILRTTIQNDLIKKKLINALISDDEDKISLVLIFEDDSRKELIINYNKTIKYDGKNYPIPENDVVEFNPSGNFNEMPYVTYSGNDTYNDKFLTIYIPLYEYLYENDSTNYGFKIVHPVGL